jgi:hypothetical protein
LQSTARGSETKEENKKPIGIYKEKQVIERKREGGTEREEERKRDNPWRIAEDPAPGLSVRERERGRGSVLKPAQA